MSDSQPLGDNRPAAYMEGDRIILRASSIDDPSLHPKMAGLQGFEPKPTPAWLQEKFDEGNWAEGPLLQRLATRGWVGEGASHEGDGQLELDWELPFGVTIRVHPDEIGVPYINAGDDTTKKGRRVWEVKALSSLNFEKARKKGIGSLPYGYDLQIAVQMHASGLMGVAIAADKGACRIADEHSPKSFLWSKGTLHVEWFDEPPYPKAHFIKIAKKIRAAYETGELYVEDCKASPCAYEYQHAGLSSPEEADGDGWGNSAQVAGGVLSDDDKAKLARLSRAYYNVGQDIKDCKETQAIIRGEIEELLVVSSESAAKTFEVAGWKAGYEATTRTITEVVAREPATKWTCKWVGGGSAPPPENPMEGLEMLEDGDPTQ